ncbi:MAG: hypothetical protein H7178_03290 [Chitinophagaceae bacterium]|nr:hypothetical protein [Chitinophagaceae bacterium]
MKKAVIFLLMLVACFQVSTAQTYKPHKGFRMLRQDEIAYLNNLYQTLYNAIPHEYKDWRANGDGKEFSAVKHWCDVEPDFDKCTGICPVTLGKTDPYSISLNMDFAMLDQESSGLMIAAYQGITDYTNPMQIAKALKSAAKSKISIRIYNNIFAPDGSFSSNQFGISYCPKVPPVKIQLPIYAALAVMGIRSDACPILDESTKQADMHGNYYDNALIVLGKPIVKKAEKMYDYGLKNNAYAIAFDNKQIGKLINQNIMIRITGDAADIDAVIKLIDWKKLESMVAK